jgi:hypothetical protein
MNLTKNTNSTKPFTSKTPGLLAVLGTALLAATPTPGFGNDYEYDWVGGAPGISGELILDSPMNSGGWISDIVYGQFTTPGGTFNIDARGPGMDPAGSSLLNFGGPDDLPFAWDPSQLTSAYIVMQNSSFQWAIGENFRDDGRNLLEVEELPGGLPYWADESGSWVATAAPDGANTLMLLGACFSGLALGATRIAARPAA